MAFFFTSNPLRQQTRLYSIPPCKCPSTLNSFNSHFSSSLLTFSPSKHPLQPRFKPLLIARTPVAPIDTQLSITDQEISNNSSNGRNNIQIGSAISHSSANSRRVGRKKVKDNVCSRDGEKHLGMSDTKDGHTGKILGSGERSGMFFTFPYLLSRREYFLKYLADRIGRTENNTEKGEKSWKGFVVKQLGVEKREEGDQKSDVHSLDLRRMLGMCSRKGDVMGALILYDSARRDGKVLDQLHYNILLRLCSNAAAGIAGNAISWGSCSSLSSLNWDSTSEVSTLDSEELGKFVESVYQWVLSDSIDKEYVGLPTEVGTYTRNSSFDGKKFAEFYNGDAELNRQVMDGPIEIGIGDYGIGNIEDSNSAENFDFRVSNFFKDYALFRGFEICERMCLEEVPMNEVSLSCVARLYMALGDGDAAFFMVKQMKPQGIHPKLRSYGPALSAFCKCGDVDKAFSVEKHMLKQGVHPEEPELEALLRVSIEAGRSDKIYYTLHKLRACVAKITPPIADLLEKWFKSKVASKVGRRKVDERLIAKAIENGYGGWHGQGWLGKGKWNVFHTSVGTDGLCKCCGEKLAIIDLDPIEIEKFAELVASIAAELEKNSGFQEFRKWLDNNGPFEAVVDGSNFGFRVRKSLKSPLGMVTKVNAMVDGIRQLLPSKKWPLIVLPNNCVPWDKKQELREMIDEWKTAGALYVIPTGSAEIFDDWFWLYAAVKCKGLIVTNDEMRAPLFRHLGKDFFPRWKERHQVRFSFSDNSPVIHMPPPYSIFIQESEKGHWHIPIASEHKYERERTWLCITRGNLPESKQVTATIHHEGNHLPGETQVTAATNEESQSPVYNKGWKSSDTPTQPEAKQLRRNIGNQNENRNSKQLCDKFLSSVLKLLSPLTPSISKYPTILPQIEAAEKLGNCVIDFEI